MTLVDPNGHGAKASWKILGFMAACIIATVTLMWNGSALIDKLQDTDSSLETEVAMLKSSAMSTEDLVKLEHRMTVLEEGIAFLQKDSHPKGSD